LVFLHEERFELNPLTPAAVRGTSGEDTAWRPYAAAVQHGGSTEDELVALLEHVLPEFRSALVGADGGAEAALDDAARRHPELVTRAVREAARRYVPGTGRA
jgi:hypothetical protein